MVILKTNVPDKTLHRDTENEITRFQRVTKKS